MSYTSYSLHYDNLKELEHLNKDAYNQALPLVEQAYSLDYRFRILKCKERNIQVEMLHKSKIEDLIELTEGKTLYFYL